MADSLPDAVRARPVGILQVQVHSLSIEGELPLEDIARRTEGWSGAEVCAIWTEAALVAAKG
mgnify:CR=1 FL=1